MMNVNRFELGKNIVKIALAASLVLMLYALMFTTEQSTARLVATVLAIALIVVAIVAVCVLCRCRSCGRVVFFGLLNRTSCPHCKRSFTTGKKVKKSKARM